MQIQFRGNTNIVNAIAPVDEEYTEQGEEPPIGYRFPEDYQLGIVVLIPIEWLDFNS